MPGPDPTPAQVRKQERTGRDRAEGGAEFPPLSDHSTHRLAPSLSPLSRVRTPLSSHYPPRPSKAEGFGAEAVGNQAGLGHSTAPAVPTTPTRESGAAHLPGVGAWTDLGHGPGTHRAPRNFHCRVAGERGGGGGIAGRDLGGWAKGGPRPGPPLGGCWLERTSGCGPRVQPLNRLGPPVPAGQGVGPLRHN